MNEHLSLNLFPPKFTALFRDQLGFTPEEFTVFAASFRIGSLAPKQHFLQVGDVMRQKAYLKKGCVRNYVIDDKGKEHTQFFAFEDWWIGDLESYYTQTPSRSYVQALEPCELLVISRHDWLLAEAQIPKFQQWFAQKMQPALFAMLNRLNEIKTCSPEERYTALLAKHADIFQRVPLHYIASYLDIEPPSLSRLRKRMMEKKLTGTGVFS